MPNTAQCQISPKFNFGFAVLLCALGTSLPIDQAAAQATNLPQNVKLRDDEIKPNPYSQFGEFHDFDDEDDQTTFFQYGRFFGASIGTGYRSVLGNRGAVYQGGFPELMFRVHYWFDFQWALQIGINTVRHRTDYDGIRTDINFFGLGLDLKYYLETRNASAAISFANPYLLIGMGSLSKTETSSDIGQGAPDPSFMYSLGGGLEFPIVHRKTYFQLEFRYQGANQFVDMGSQEFLNVVPDLSGDYFIISGHILFTW